MSFSRSLISSALLSGALFTALLIPFTTLGSRPVTLQVDDQPVFSGRLDDLATPYLSFATALSLGFGAAAFSFLSWQASVQKLNRTEEQILGLRQKLDEREALLEHFKFSESKLQAAGLSFFLDSEMISDQAVQTNSQHAIFRPEKPSPRLAAAPVTSQAAPQSRVAIATEQVAEPSAANDDYNLHDPVQVEQLLVQLKQVMTQIEKLHIS